eukprot:UN04424
MMIVCICTEFAKKEGKRKGMRTMFVFGDICMFLICVWDFHDLCLFALISKNDNCMMGYTSTSCCCCCMLGRQRKGGGSNGHKRISF